MEYEVAAASDASRQNCSGTPAPKAAQVTLLGEAKATNKQRNGADLRRLIHIRELLGPRAENAALVLFSRTGFAAELHQAQANREVTLVELSDIYQRFQ